MLNWTCDSVVSQIGFIERTRTLLKINLEFIRPDYFLSVTNARSSVKFKMVKYKIISCPVCGVGELGMDV